MIEKTDGWLLDGRVRYAQPRTGFRTGIEPVFLAAAVPAVPGERVLEAGTGAGAGLLCLAHRVGDIEGVGLERESSLAELANENFTANGARGVHAIARDVTALAPNETFDHVFANPPWRAATGTAPRDPMRTRATRGADLACWIRILAALLRRRGTMTLILPASSLAAAISALDQASCGSIVAFPLWPKQERAAKLVLLQAASGTRAPLRLLPGITLHRQDGRFTPEADAVLREGAALTLRTGTGNATRSRPSARFGVGVPQVP